MNLSSHFSAVGLVGWLADFYLPATLLMLVAIVARRWIRQPAQRLTVHWIVAVELAVLAVVCAMPFWPRISLRGAAAQQSAVETPIAAQDPLPVPAPLPQTAFPRFPREVPEFDAPVTPDVDQPVVPPIAPPPRWSWLEMAAVAYLASAGLVVVWLIWGGVAAARACRHAENAPGSLREELARIVGDGRRVPRLLVSSRVKTAVALGLRRPTILLPAGLVEEASPQAIRAVLTHEWAHIRNDDLWLLALGRCLLVLLFPHPLLWWLRRAIRGDQELLADAAAAGDNRPAYAEELLRLVRKTAYPSPIAASVAVGIWESSSQLSRRIAMLLDENFRVEPRASRRWRYRVLGLLVLLGGAGSLVTFQPARSAGQSAQADSPRPYSGEGQGVRASDSSRAVTGDAQGAKERNTSPAVTTTTSTATITGTSEWPASEEDRIALPVQRLWLLMQYSVLNELKLTGQQRQKLHATQEKYYAESSKFFAEAVKVKKLPQDKIMLAYRQWEREQNKKIEQQVAEILTREQMQLLKELTFREKAFMRLFDPDAVKKLNLTQQQKDAWHSLGKEANDWLLQHDREAIDKTLSILNAQQQARLREEALGPLGPEDCLVQLDVHVEGEPKPFMVYSLQPYPDLTEASIRKQLGLSAAQEQQVRAILGGSANLAERLARDVEKMSPQEREKLPRGWTSSARSYGGSAEQVAKMEEKFIKERKQARVGFAEHPAMKPGVAFRRQFEAVLTPQQLAPYRDLTVRNFTDRAINDRLMLKMIGASEQQIGDVQRICRSSAARDQVYFREMGLRLLKILTSAQEQELRAKVEEEFAFLDDLRFGAMPAAENDSGNSVRFGSGSLTHDGSKSPTDAANTKVSGKVIKAVVDKSDIAPQAGPPESSGIGIFEYAADSVSDTMPLPAYGELRNPAILKAVALSERQKHELLPISHAWSAVFKKANEEEQAWQSLSLRQKEAKLNERRASQEAFQRTARQMTQECRKKVAELLTPAQMETYKRLALPKMAYPRLCDPAVLKGIALSGEQENRIKQFQAKLGSGTTWTHEDDAALLAVLNPEQLKKLRIEVEREYFSSFDARAETVAFMNDEIYSGSIGPISDSKPVPAPKAAGSIYLLPIYEMLNVPKARTYFGMSAAQERQLQEIAANYQAAHTKIRKAKEALTSAESKLKLPELRKQSATAANEVRQRIEAVLTPQQLAAVKESIVNRDVPQSLLLDPGSSRLLGRIGLGDQQMATLRRKRQDKIDNGERAIGEFEQELFAVLTPAQQQRIREAIERSGW